MKRTISFLLVLACAAPAPAAKSVEPTAPASVTLSDQSGSLVKVTVEIADDNAERQQGLMHRTQLEEMAGMLFLFPNEAHQTFWMKDTPLPLDMIFIRSDMTVLGIVENAEPMTTTSRSVPGTSQYVLEVNAGWAQRHNVAAGSRLRFDDVNLKAIK